MLYEVITYQLADGLFSSARSLSTHVYLLFAEGVSFDKAFATATVITSYSIHYTKLYDGREQPVGQLVVRAHREDQRGRLADGSAHGQDHAGRYARHRRGP